MRLPIAKMMTVLLLVGYALWAEPPSKQESSLAQAHRRFTVQDSIEMARFGRYRGEPVFSPDRKHFAVITSRGILRSNEIESTLWIFRSEEVQDYLTGAAKQPTPKAAARVVAVPQQQYLDSYGAVITDLRWLPDSKGLLFLAQKPDGRRELRQVTLASRTVRSIAAGDNDVLQFHSSNGVVLFSAQPKEVGVREKVSASKVITGMSLTKILFPSTSGAQRPGELWFSRSGAPRRLMEPSTGKVIRIARRPGSQSVMALSPDGRAAVILLSSTVIPKEWESYTPVFEYLRLDSNNSNSADIFWPAQYASIDLSSGKVRVLVDAPNAWSLGSADQNQAVWSSDGKKILVTNTYLPLSTAGMSEQSIRAHHCAAAVIELSTHTTECIVLADYPRANRHLEEASFGRDHNEVVLQFWNSGNVVTREEYVCKERAWTAVKVVTVASSEAEIRERELAPFAIKIKQDLNTPPALWAKAKDLNSAEKKIWDPNPQLSGLDLGDASEFHWKDASGYAWVGGLVKPPGYTPGKRYPLVIQTHGFQANEFMSDGAFTTSFAARPLAAAGIVVLQVPTRHDHQVTEAEAPDQVEGFRSAVERLTADGIVDAGKVGIIGFSRTCYYVETALVTHPELFVAATITDGVDESYMQYLLFGAGQQLLAETAQIYGGPPFGAGLQRWIERAPGFHLDRVRAPLRIEAIKPASVLSEWEIYASLLMQKKPVDFIYFPDGQHILQKPLERLASQQGNVDWYRFWLKGEEDSDPAKTEQYTRWRELRKLRQQNETKHKGTGSAH